MLRRRLFAGAALLCLLLGNAMGQNASSELQKQLIAADRGIWEGIANHPGKVDTVSAAMAPDYIDIDSGIRHSRNEAIEYMKGLTKFAFQYENAKAYVLSPTSGYVIAELTYSSVQNGKADSGRVLTTTVFSADRGRWVAHLHTEMDTKPAGH